MTEDEKQSEGEEGARQRMGEGIRSGIGVLSAFKDALEETIREARERGDLSAERARQLMREALDKAQSAASGARERLDFAHQAELEELERRVAALEESVFGSTQESAQEESGEPEAQ